MSDPIITFTPKTQSLSNLESFKKAVLSGLRLSSIPSLKTDEDWRDLLGETRVKLTQYSEVMLLPTSYSDQYDSIDDVQFAHGKAKTQPQGDTDPATIAEASSSLPQPILDSLRP